MHDPHMRILPIDFQKPWWQIITDQKWLASAVFGLFIFRKTFSTLIPLMLSYTLAQGRIDYFCYFFAAWFFMNTLHYVTRNLNPRLQLQCIHSLHFNAHQQLLKIDPLYHATQSGGVAIGKIHLASRAYEHLLDAIFFEAIPLLTGLAVSTISLAYYSLPMGLAAVAMLTSMALVAFWFMRHALIPRDKKVILADEKVKARGFENLVQINLIRSTFGTREQSKRLYDKDVDMMHAEGDLWTTYATLYYVMRCLYWLSMVIIGYFIFSYIHTGRMPLAIGIGLLTTYLRGTYPIMRIERPIRNSTKSILRITDLYNFIRAFGEQSFPVIKPGESESEKEFKKELVISKADKNISLAAENVYFDYLETGKIFDDHSLHLSVPKDEDLKLFGVIGPSGTGKTTFLSILGGQLKPNRGTITINDIDIYQLDDAMRRRLIALQGQTASSLRGTVRYNLLFGLPREEKCYRDEQLIDVLKKVGLWEIFESKAGILTQIGQSGTTLSGGQRQRLNFASLYLRAKYYKPPLILIDEPTSSLDQISEKAITSMIEELAHDALTIVIAHRLNTLQEAVGILDFSLLETEKEMRFLSQNELLEYSPYYKRLLTGGEEL